MSVIHHSALPGHDVHTDNPLDIWGRRIAVAVTVIVAVPTLIIGMIALLS
ncbi:hypothetical protein [Leifsonia sp. 2MCAF36]